jgi:hypothetical protein
MEAQLGMARRGSAGLGMARQGKAIDKCQLLNDEMPPPIGEENDVSNCPLPDPDNDPDDDEEDDLWEEDDECPLLRI